MIEIKEHQSRVEISQQARDDSRNEIIQSGLYYIVPLEKYGHYADGELKMVDVGLAAARYLNRFIPQGDGQSIAVDLEQTLHFAVLPEEIGLGNGNLEKMEQGLCTLALVPQKLLRIPQVRKLIEGNISDKDRALLEFEMFDPNSDYVGPASIMRADLLLTAGGKALSCDPNLVPLGYSITAEICRRTAEKSKLPLGPSPDYLMGIFEEVSRHPDRISGILTGINYPNWPSHKALCDEVRRSFGIPFFVIPSDCLDAGGTVDFAKLNAFNAAFGIPNVSGEISNIPGVLIRYTRENTQFHPSSKVVNKPGIRMVETQFWGGFLALPGIEELARESGVDMDQIKEALDITVPTLIARRNGNKIEIATSVAKSSSGDLDLTWETINPPAKEGDPEPRLDILQKMLLAIDCQEKPQELSWFIKTLTTSGKKGVRYTSDGRIDQTAKNLNKVLDKMGMEMGMESGKIFLIQPKIRSVIEDNGQEYRTKIDFYLSFNSGKCVALDYMATPIQQKTAHAGSATRLGLVLRNGK